MAIEFLFVIAILLSGSLTAAQDEYVRNFQVVSQNSTHITFSWDIVDGYYSSSYINYFHLYYQHRSYTHSRYIGYHSATRSGATFRYTRSVQTFNNGPYIMWVEVYRASLDPGYTYSRTKYVNINEAEIYTVLELKVHLQPTQTCSEFRHAITQTRREVNWILHQSCQIPLPYDLSLQDDYFTCTTSGYVIFRAKLSTPDPSIDLISLVANLSNFLTRQDGKARIIVNGGGYLVEAGPCGVTIPHLSSPHCFNDTNDSVDTSPTQAAIASPCQNSTVTTIVATMCAVMLMVMLCGCIVFLVMGLWKIKHRRAKTAEARATYDLEMPSAGPSRSIPLPQEHDRVYANTGVPIKPNPRYGRVK